MTFENNRSPRFLFRGLLNVAVSISLPFTPPTSYSRSSLLRKAKPTDSLRRRAGTAPKQRPQHFLNSTSELQRFVKYVVNIANIVTKKKQYSRFSIYPSYRIIY